MTRYDLEYEIFDGSAWMEEKDDGEFVMYVTAKDIITELEQQNAKLVEALEKISKLDYKHAANNCCAYDAVQVAADVLKGVKGEHT